MIHVIATSHLKPGCREKFLGILKANVPKVLAEAGCVQYAPCVDLEGGPRTPEPDIVTILETWESLAHLQAHFQAPHMKAFVEAVKDMRVSASARVVEPA
jgi:quinol monooxygenase YgiN